MFTCDKTRECRANNFLGISFSHTYAWENIDLSKSVPNRVTNKSYPGFDDLLGDMLAMFISFQDGMNAALWRLATYFKGGLNTPETIYNEWSGDNADKAAIENRVTKGSSIARMMGCKPSDKLLFHLNDLKDLIHAMLRYEDSTLIFESDLINIPDEMYQVAIEYALRKVNDAVPAIAGINLRSNTMPPGLPATMPEPTPAPGVAQPVVQGQAMAQMAIVPKEPFMNLDAMASFGLSFVLAVLPIVTKQFPQYTPICESLSATCAFLGTALHLDGK